MKLINKCKIFACVLFSINTQVHGQYNMESVNSLISDVRSVGLMRVDNSFEEEARQDHPKFKSLENKVKADWSNIIDHISDIKGGDSAKILVVTTLQALPASDYMTAIENLTTLYETDTISKRVYKSVIHCNGRMKVFLADNYDHSRVIAVLNRVKVKAASDADLVTHINSLLDGSTKLAFDKFRDAHQNLAAGNIPVILLPQQ